MAEESKINPMTKNSLSMVVLPCQMGKTFICTEKILSTLEEEPNTVSIVLTSNTLLNNTQFGKRIIETGIETKFGKGSVVVFRSKYEGPYRYAKTLPELKGFFLDDVYPRVIIVCGNQKRFNDITDIVSKLNNNYSKIKQIYIYYDELHSYITPLLREQIRNINNLNVVKSIVGLTATPDKIFETEGFFKKLNVSHINYNDVNYAGVQDVNFIVKDHTDIQAEYFDFDLPLKKQDKLVIGYIQHILDHNRNILDKNTRTFIPARNSCMTHSRVRDIVFQMNQNAVVAVINGESKVLQYKDETGNMTSISLNSSEQEFCETISSIVLEKGLQSRPLVITGYICVNMGSTLTHPSTGSFTTAIFGQTEKHKDDDLYQLFGRVSGRIKHWTTYTKTNVYCSTHFKTVVSGMEQCAKNVALNHNGKSITREEYHKPHGDRPLNKKESEYGITEPFNTLGELILILNNHKKYQGNLKRRNFPIHRKNNTTTIRYRKMDKPLEVYTTADQFKTLDIYSGLNKKGGKSTCSTMPCIYKNEIKWVGIYLKSEYSFDGRVEESKGRVEESKGRVEESKGRVEESKDRVEESKDEKIINPKTNRPIMVSGSAYKKLSEEEKEEGVRLWKQRTSTPQTPPASTPLASTPPVQTKEEKIINPKTNRPIMVSGSAYKKLSEKEKEEGARLWKQRIGVTERLSQFNL
jgi:hypothetical protein